jgi:hypothetical protein
VLHPEKYAVACEWARQIKTEAEAGRIDCDRPEVDITTKTPISTGYDYGLESWRRAPRFMQTTKRAPAPWGKALFTRAALKGYADSVGERPPFLFPETARQAGPFAADQGAPAPDTKEPPQEWRNGLKRIAYEEAVKLIRAHGVLHGPALWAAMKARDDVKEAGRDSDQIEPKVCESKLTRGEGRVSKTQVQNAWRKSLAELLK